MISTRPRTALSPLIRVLCWLFVVFLLGLGLASCGNRVAQGQSLPGTGTIPPVLPEDAARFSWTDSGILADQGDRILDITASPATLTLGAPQDITTTIGLFAVDALAEPSFDGLTLLTEMPTESAFTIQPDGTALFTYFDLFDPYWREREPEWKQETIDGKIQTIDRLWDDSVTAKVLLDATASQPNDLLYWLDPENRVTFYATGTLQYCFSFGRPVRSFRLTDPSGSLHTALETPSGFRVRLSGDGGASWETIWTAPGEGMHTPDVSLPSGLQGVQNLCLRFDGGGDTFSIRRLYLTVGFQAPTLATVYTRFPAGDRIIQYQDKGLVPPRAILFWDDPAIAPARSHVTYPSAGPTIQETSDKLEVRFPGQILLEFPRNLVGAPGQLSRLVIGQQTVLKAPPRQPWTSAGVVTLLDGTASPITSRTDWEMLRNKYLSSGKWDTTWSRSQRRLPLELATFQHAKVVGDEVVLTWTITDSGKTGALEWIFSQEETSVAGQRFPGVGMRLRVSGAGLKSAQSVQLTFPLVMARNDWQVEQFFRVLSEEPFTFQGAPRYPRARWFGESQSFVFRSGPGRTVLALFQDPVAATVRLSEEEGRHVYDFDIPLGVGDTRETPKLLWFATPKGGAERLTVNDIWAQLFEQVKSGYSADAGVVASRPVPSVVWNLPLEEGAWFDQFRQVQLPRAEAAGIRNVIIQTPWESDVEHPPHSDLGSGHAPWDFTVSPAWGGEAALKRLVDEAHDRGVQVTLWYPSGFSLYSSIAVTHTDWLAWEMSGEPWDGGWGDVVSPDPGSAYRSYAIDKITGLHDRIPFDGLWFDSWAGMTILTDYADEQPAPTLDQAIALQRAFSQLGLEHILIEGMGPLGRPDAYGDYEAYTGEPNPNPTQVQELERLREREYLLYRMGAGTYIDMAIYHRALAAGGLLNIANFDEIDYLDKDWLKRINLEHRQVVDRMQHRKLLVADGRWLGVAWSQDGTDDLVIFAFDQPFQYQLGGQACVTDLSQGPQTLTGSLTTQAWRTYLIQPGEACPTLFLPAVARN